MNPDDYMSLYIKMLAEISENQYKEQDHFNEIETSFKIASSYFERLPIFPLQSYQAEFFRKYKPLFESEVKFHELRYYAELCRPRKSFHQLKTFCIQEIDKLGKLMDEYPALYGWFKDKTTICAMEWFDEDMETAKKNSSILSKFMALTRYIQYIEASFNRFSNHLLQ